MTNKASIYAYRGFSSVGQLTPSGIYTDSQSVESFNDFIDKLLFEYAKKARHPNPAEFALLFPNLVGSEPGQQEPEPDGIYRIRRAANYDYSPLLRSLL